MVHDSIYYYKGVGEFRRFIQRIDNKQLSISEALGTFRETKCLSNEFKRMTIQNVTDKPELILRLFEALHRGMEPESKFKLPYKKVVREQELIKSLAETYPIDMEKTKARIVTGHYKNDRTRQEFNYALEVVIGPRTDKGVSDAGSIDIIGNINSTPSIDGGENYFDGAYYWLDKNHKQINSTNIRGILQECGFTSSNYISASRKKVPSVLYIDLQTPCPDWLGAAGKTHLDIAPYAKEIAQTVSTLAYKIPSYHGCGFGWSRESYSDTQKAARSYLEDFLTKRFDSIEGEPSLKFTDPLTQSGVWYRIRPLMVEKGYNPKKNWGETRRYITSLIDKLCEELFENVEREDLGIVAKARAMMLYDGRTFPITLDSFKGLGTKGVFILVIEKEGIATIFENVAKDSGIALVHTAGRFTKYLRYFIEQAQVPVATLTDYDAYGVEISAATDTPRIGIDMDIIDWLRQNGYPNLRREDMEEEYSCNLRINNEYLRNHRIELDSIAAKVGPKVFWQYIKHKNEQLRQDKGFDYSNIIHEPEPEALYPKAFVKLKLKFNELVKKATENTWQKIEAELYASEKLISITKTEEKNLDILSKMMANDRVIQEKVVPKINNLLNELRNI